MSLDELKKIKPDELKLSERGALKIAMRAAEGDWQIAKEIIDRDEGKAVERVEQTNITPASDEKIKETARLIYHARGTG